MANAAAIKNIEAWTDNVESVVLEYDFDNDTGATGAYVLGTFKQNSLILRANWYVEAACTSAGSATVEIGVNDADANAILDTTSGAVANLTDSAAGTETAATLLYVPSGDTVDLNIAAAALTAGKIKVHIDYVKVV